MSVFPAELESLRAAFLESLRVRGQAPATLDSRSESFSTFFRWLTGQGIGDVREVTREHIRAYLHWLLKNPAFTTATVHVKIGGVRRLFEWLEATDAVLFNPCSGVSLPRLENRLPRAVLTQAEARRLLDAPDPQTNIGIRDRAILELFYSTGIRGEEMATLTVHDIDPRGGFVRVTKGKFAKDRVVPMGETAGDCVREYLARVRRAWSEHQQDERALWLSAVWPHHPIQKQAIAVMVNGYKKLAAIERVGRTHLWRHSCATHMVQNGASLLYVQRLLGHRSLDTTQIYTRVAIPELAATIRKSHPRSRSARTEKHP